MKTEVHTCYGGNDIKKKKKNLEGRTRESLDRLSQNSFQQVFLQSWSSSCAVVDINQDNAS